MHLSASVSRFLRCFCSEICTSIMHSTSLLMPLPPSLTLRSRTITNPSRVVAQRTDDHSVDTPSSRPPTSRRPRSSSSPSSHCTPAWPSPSRSCSSHTAARSARQAARRRVKLIKTTTLRTVRVGWLGCSLVFKVGECDVREGDGSKKMSTCSCRYGLEPSL